MDHNNSLYIGIFLAIIFIASSPYILLTEEEDDTLYTYPHVIPITMLHFTHDQ